jgi:hypothetical protein
MEIETLAPADANGRYFPKDRMSAGGNSEVFIKTPAPVSNRMVQVFLFITA